MIIAHLRILAQLWAAFVNMEIAPSQVRTEPSDNSETQDHNHRDNHIQERYIEVQGNKLQSEIAKMSRVIPLR